MIRKKIIIATIIVSIMSLGILLAMSRHIAVAQETGSDATYVLGSKCKTCHIKIFKAHADTPHGTAFENIKDAGESANVTCLQCHSTGFGKPGGFVDEGTTADLAGVTCQACHGPGSIHAAAAKEQKKETAGKVTGEVCIKCHKNHEGHLELGSKELPYLKKKLEKLQNKIKELESK
jgi:nitrate/TMAO reductase-like tetraheme cytochrome c subunit